MIRDELLAVAGTPQKVRLTRSFPGDSDHNGFVVAIGREWVLIHSFHDFYPEGHAVLRIADITEFRSGEYERVWERMLAAEGLLAGIEPPGDVSLKDISHLLSSLHRRRHNVIIECEDLDDEDDDEFYIGRIVSVENDAVRFAPFDALGNWDEMGVILPFDVITQVQFDTPYVRTFSKYLNGPCPADGSNPTEQS